MDVLADPWLTYEPGFVQQFNISGSQDPSPEMNSPGSQRQASIWNQTSQFGGQAQNGCPVPHLGGRHALQSRWAIDGVIPFFKQRGLRADLGVIAKFMAGPEGSIPNTMKSLNLKVALGVIVWREKRINPAEQTQAYHLTHHARVGVPAAKPIFIVELLNLRQS